MPNSAANAYARVANTTASPRDIEAQALLKAANKLQDIMINHDATGERTRDALLFNRSLWSIFVSDAMKDENQQPRDVRERIANIGIFVLSQTAAIQASLQLNQLQSLIDINRNLAAGLAGRA